MYTRPVWSVAKLRTSRENQAKPNVASVTLWGNIFRWRMDCVGTATYRLPQC